MCCFCVHWTLIATIKFADAIFFVYCCKVCCIWQTQICVTRLHDKLYVSVFSFFVWVFLHYCKTYYHFFKKHVCLNCSFCSKKVRNTAISCVLLQRVPYFVSEDFPISLHAKCRWLFPVGHFYKNILNIGATIRLFCCVQFLQRKQTSNVKKQRKPLLNFSLQTSFVVLQYFYNRKKLRVTHLC